jgi:response regulator NasT
VTSILLGTQETDRETHQTRLVPATSVPHEQVVPQSQQTLIMDRGVPMHEHATAPGPQKAVPRPPATAEGGGTLRPRQHPAPDMRDELKHLQQLLITLPLIEQAKGVLMNQYALEDGVAFALLRRWSQASNTKITTIASQVVTAASLGYLPELLLTSPYNPRQRLP